jgi:hypothetical protein
VPGDFAEFGVFEGDVVRRMWELREQRQVLAFDTFEGIPSEGYIEELDFNDPPGKWKPREDVVAKLQALPGVVVVKGLFQDTLPTALVGWLALVHIDCDNYAAHKTIFAWLPDHLPHGAIVVMDDYKNCPGAMKAIDEFVAEHGLKLLHDRSHYFVWNKP